MIKDAEAFEAWERQWMRKEGRLPFSKAVRIVKALWEEGVSLGGQAVLLYGEPRLTRDMDITPGGRDQCC